MKEKRNFTIRLEKELADLIKIQAIKENTTMSELITLLIIKYLKEKKAL